MNDEQCSAEFAKRLIELRQLREQSARDMSLSLGQAPNYIHGLEAAKNYPTMKSFFYICEYLGITPKEFFDYEDADPKQERELFDEIRKLDEKSRTYLSGLIREMNNRPK
jgi:transcriptional regulator with XRE-family HTH domain